MLSNQIVCLNNHFYLGINVLHKYIRICFKYENRIYDTGIWIYEFVYTDVLYNLHMELSKLNIPFSKLFLQLLLVSKK